MSKSLRTCTNCGAWLDSGERCDCQDKTAEGTATAPQKPEPKQATLNPCEPVPATGA